MTKFLEGKSALLTTSHTDVGSGGSMQMFLLARGLVQAGAKVDILFKQSKPGKTPKLDLYDELDVKLDFFRPNRWYNPAEISRMRKRLQAGRYDIVHTHKGGDLSLVLLGGRGIDIPALINTRGVNFPLGLNRFKYNVKKLDRIIVVSEQSKKVMVGCGVKADKINVIYGGVDTERFSPQGSDVRKQIREEFALPDSATVFVVVANLVRQKGHEDYIQAASILNQSHPDCFHIFAGSGDPAALQAKARELGVEKNIVFAGFRTDMPALFAGSDISVFPGFAGEGVSGVLRESLACKVPVITTDVGGNAELIQNEKYGLVVPIRVPEKLAAAMARLVVDSALANTLAEQGRKFVVENHSVQARNQRIFSLYQSIIESKI